MTKETTTITKHIPHTNDFLYEEVQSFIRKSPACHHPLFKEILTDTYQRGLTPEQFETFRADMFFRIHYTLQSLCHYAQKSLKRGQDKQASTVFMNINEESAGGVYVNMHPLLMEKAFNALGAVFNLKPTTAFDCAQNPKYPEQVIYKFSIISLYKSKYASAISAAQEFASGGDNQSGEHAIGGMMEDLYHIFYAYRHNVGLERFKSEILPYFAAHLTIDEKTMSILHDGHAIEFQHGQRAKEDLIAMLDQLPSPRHKDQCLLYIDAYLNLQDTLFNRMLGEFKSKQAGPTVPIIDSNNAYQWQEKLLTSNISGSLQALRI